MCHRPRAHCVADWALVPQWRAIIGAACVTCDCGLSSFPAPCQHSWHWSAARGAGFANAMPTACFCSSTSAVSCSGQRTRRVERCRLVVDDVVGLNISAGSLCPRCRRSSRDIILIWLTASASGERHPQ